MKVILGGMVVGKLDINDVYNPGELKVKGEHSGRHFDPDNAGGTILKLDWRGAKVTDEGISIVEKHISRFPLDPDNAKMIERLKKIKKGEIEATDIDKRFYTHEMREYERYKNLGVKDGVDPGDKVWSDAHAATLEDFKVDERLQPLYK